MSGIKNPNSLELQDVLQDLKRHVWDSSAEVPEPPEPEVVTILKGLMIEGQKQHPLARKARKVKRKGDK